LNSCLVKMTSMKSLVLTLLLVLLPVATQAHEIKIGDLVIVHPMVDEAKKGQAEARGSIEIRNEGTTPDQVLSISSEFADKVTIEVHVPVTIPANGRVVIPILFLNIKRELSELEAYDGELELKKAGTIKIDLMVHSHPH
jgi:periplasmic copper chaperone A